MRIFLSLNYGYVRSFLETGSLQPSLLKLRNQPWIRQK